MWWEFEEEGYRYTITPNREDNMPRQLQGKKWREKIERFSTGL